MSSKELIVLITGVNSGLGLALVQRLVADFVTSHISHTLTLIFTTRSTSKSAATLTCLFNHTANLDRAGHNATSRIKFNALQVDLTDLPSVVELARHLRKNFNKIDVAIFNAGMGSFTGIDWIKCFKSLAMDWVHAVTYPEYKIQAIGWARDQKVATIPIIKQNATSAIGEVFCANVFGHYFLAHEIMPLLKHGGDDQGTVAGRIIWVSSLEAYKSAYDVEDLEGLKTMHSYESSKRLTDIISLTASIPATEPYTQSFFSLDDIEDISHRYDKKRVRCYLTHPGICATSIFQLHLVLSLAMTLAFYIARWLGSPWHVVKPWLGAASMCQLALANSEDLEEKHAEQIKWGSATNFWGISEVRQTEVEDGDGEDWELMARATWKKMEELRKCWKKRLEV